MQVFWVALFVFSFWSLVANAGAGGEPLFAGAQVLTWLTGWQAVQRRDVVNM